MWNPISNPSAASAATCSARRPASLGIGPDEPSEGRIELVDPPRRERLDGPAELVDVGAWAADPEGTEVEVAVAGLLEPLPPEPVRAPEARASEEERRRRPGPREDRRGRLDVGAEIVVERDRDRKRLPGPPLAGGLE